MDDDFATALMKWAWYYCGTECAILHQADESCPYWAAPIALTRLTPRSIQEQSKFMKIRSDVILWANSEKDLYGHSAGQLIKEYIRSYVEG